MNNKKSEVETESKKKEPESEITDGELEKVSGGFNPQPDPPVATRTPQES